MTEEPRECQAALEVRVAVLEARLEERTGAAKEALRVAEDHAKSLRNAVYSLAIALIMAVVGLMGTVIAAFGWPHK